MIQTTDCKINIKDTQKKVGDLFVHIGKIEIGSIKVGESVNLSIDTQKRNNSKANHSATHLLHELLRRVLGDHVTQKGSLVEPNRLIFYFSHMKPIKKKDVEKIEIIVNSMLANKTEVRTRLMTQV